MPECDIVITTDSTGSMHHLTRATACAIAVDDASAAADVCGVAARGAAVGDGRSAVTQACRDGAIWACVT